MSSKTLVGDLSKFNEPSNENSIKSEGNTFLVHQKNKKS